MSRESFSAQSVLVTGASGFVGRAVCTKLLEGPFLVSGAIRGSCPTNFPAGVRAVTIGAITQDTDWTEALEDVDTVIHLAARVHVQDESSRDPLAAFRQVNVEGTARLARMAAARGVRRLIYVSSVKVLGEEAVAPYTADSEPAPLGPYGMSKREAEDCLVKIAAETGLEVVILRPPLVYGPGVKANFLRLIKLVRSKTPMPFGLVRNKRSMIFVENLVSAIRFCLDDINAAGQTFLVSDGEDISTPELMKKIALAMGVNLTLLPVPSAFLRIMGLVVGKKYEVERLTQSLIIDSNKIRKVLGWQPPYTLDQGIQKTVDWYLEND